MYVSWKYRQVLPLKPAFRPSEFLIFDTHQRNQRPSSPHQRFHSVPRSPTVYLNHISSVLHILLHLSSRRAHLAVGPTEPCTRTLLPSRLLPCVFCFVFGTASDAPTHHRLAELLEKQAIDVPTVTERDLQDRSKGDTISKGIVVLQTTWFVLQCVARADQRLPLSELEVLTLAFAVVNVAIYAAWWNKPQGVEMAICVPLKRAEKDIDESSTPLMEQQQHELMNVSHPELAKLPCPEHRHPNDSLSLTPPHEQQHDESTSEKHSWLRRTLRKDREQHSSPFFLLLRISFHVVISVLRPLNKLGEPVRFEKKDLRVPMFYASSRNNKSSLWTCVVGTIFGAIHLLA
jgi:hypothetical protein